MVKIFRLFYHPLLNRVRPPKIEEIKPKHPRSCPSCVSRAGRAPSLDLRSNPRPPLPKRLDTFSLIWMLLSEKWNRRIRIFQSSRGIQVMEIDRAAMALILFPI
jgi:hypothetical protein